MFPFLENVMRKFNDFGGAFDRKDIFEKIYKIIPTNKFFFQNIMNTNVG